MPAQSFEFNNFPRAFLITFCAYGTWLHGDKRGSVDRDHNRYGTARLPASRLRHNLNTSRLKNPPVKLESKQRVTVKVALEETCSMRKWDLWALNVRSNHVHIVVSAPCKPERILVALKANATRKLREANCWRYSESPWAEGGSKRYLWAETDVNEAIVYVQYEQGESLP